MDLFLASEFPFSNTRAPQGMNNVIMNKAPWLNYDCLQSTSLKTYRYQCLSLLRESTREVPPPKQQHLQTSAETDSLHPTALKFASFQVPSSLSSSSESSSASPSPPKSGTDSKILAAVSFTCVKSFSMGCKIIFEVVLCKTMEKLTIKTITKSSKSRFIPESIWFGPVKLKLMLK